MTTCRFCRKPVRREQGHLATVDPLDGGPWYCKANPDPGKRHEAGELGTCADAWRALGMDPMHPGCCRCCTSGTVAKVDAALPDGTRALVCCGVLDELEARDHAEREAADEVDLPPCEVTR